MNVGVVRPPLAPAAPAPRPLLPALCTLAIGLAGLRLYGVAVPGWLLAATLGGLLITVGVGVAWLGSGVFARPILAGAPHGDRVALTFDDGPDPVHTRRVLDLLDAAGQRATFFVIGARAESQPELLAEIVRRGHGLGNHSLRHARTTTFQPAARLAAELVRTSGIIAQAMGARPRWFRPPAGLLSPPVVEAARRAQLQIVGWSASARDGTAGATVARSLARLTAGLRPGAILVLHDAAERGDRTPIAADLLVPLLATLRARGLRSVTLDELLAPSATDRGT